MWEVDNQTPFAADGLFVRDQAGREVWVVVVRASFGIEKAGSLIRLQEQQPPIAAPQYFGSPGESSLKYDTDFVLRPPATDVLLHGKAFAPKRRPVAVLDVGIKAQGKAKVLRVHGPRLWQRLITLGPSASRPFVEMPMAYENAFGGTDPMGEQAKSPRFSAYNPVGKGFAHNRDSLDGTFAPVVEFLDHPIKAGPHSVPAAGFGPIDRAWLPRADFAGTYDEHWKKHQAPLLPKDYNPCFARQAPLDQQLDKVLAPGQEIAARNLFPTEFVSIAVPSLEFSIRAIFSDGDGKATASLDSVFLESDPARVRFVWRATYECHGREDRLKSTEVRMQGRRSWREEFAGEKV